MNRLSKTSLKKLDTCADDLQVIIKEAIKTSMIDFGISEGHRTVAKQKEYYKAGKSRCDGVKIKSKHQSKPSIAVDIYAYYNGGAHWDDIHLAYLGGHIMATADMLYQKGKINDNLRWGANWDGDGILVYDHTLKDLPHFELV